MTVLKSVGPKLVPFFKTLVIFYVLFPEESYLESIFYCAIKCLPVISLMIFVLLHGMSFSEYYSYSRKVLVGLIFSALGDAFLVWKPCGYFTHGLLSFAIAQLSYAWAFGFKPFNAKAGAVCFGIGGSIYLYLLPGLEGTMVYLAAAYVTLISTMLWRATSRMPLAEEWPWTKICSCLGAICFVISDMVIAIDKFRYPVPYSHPIIMTTYYAAQLGISLSVVDSQYETLMAKKKVV